MGRFSASSAMPAVLPRSSTPSIRLIAAARTSSGSEKSATGACRRSRFAPTRRTEILSLRDPTSTFDARSWRLGIDPPILSLAFIVLDASDVERLLPMQECIEVMTQAFADLQRGDLVQPLRAFYAPPGVKGGTLWMPAYRSRPKPMFGTKLLFVLSDNTSRGLDSHQGQVILADGETGELRALIDASAVTAIRTAAVSALATRLLSKEDARVLAIVGTGVQARKHLESIPLVRHLEQVFIAGRTRDHAQ